MEEKHQKFIAAVRKRKNASGHQGEMSGSERKNEQEHIKRVTRKFLELSR